MKMKMWIAGLLMIAGSAQAAESVQWGNGPSFTAQLKESNKYMSGAGKKSSVWVSKHGVRMEAPAPDGSKIVSLVKKDGAYMLFTGKRMYFNPGEGPSQPVDKGSVAVFSTKVCMDHKSSKKTGTVNIKGRKLEKWMCNNQSGVEDSVHLFDPELGRVVREELPDGTITELTNIAVKKLPRKFFEIPSDYRKVTMQDLFTGAVQLPAFQ